MSYFGNIAVYTACILVIFLLGINTKEGKKVLTLSIVTAAVSLVVQVGADFLMNILLYIVSDEGDLYSGGAVLWDVVNFAFPLVTVIIISIVAGCPKKSPVIVVITGLCLLASVYIEYTEFLIFSDAIADIGNVVGSAATEREMRVMATSQEIFNKISPVAYIFLLWVKGKEKK